MASARATRRQANTPQRGARSGPRQRNDNTSDRGSGFAPQSRSVSRSGQRSAPGWKTWPELSVRLDGLPLDTTTIQLWQWFSAEGNICWMDVFDPHSNGETMSARVSFEPPPKRPFWEAGEVVVKHPDQANYPDGLKLKMSLGREGSRGWWTSRICPDRKYPMIITAVLRSLEFGATVGPTSMNVRKSLVASPGANDFSIEVDVRSKRLTVHFPITTRTSSGQRTTPFKFVVVDMSQIKTMYQTTLGDGKEALVIPLPSAPHYFWKNDDILQSFSSTNPSWSSRDSWYRATDIVEDNTAPLRYPVAVHNDIPDPGYMEIGRWTTFRLVLDVESESAKSSLQHLQMALEDFNIKTEVCDNFQLVSSSKTMWDHLDHPPIADAGSAGDALALLQMPESPIVHLDFKVRYQLEVCVTRGIFNEHTISIEFLNELAALDPFDATRRLEFLADQNEVYHDPMRLFTSREAESYIPNTRIPHYCALVRKAIVTPTTIRFNSPTVETSNRVMRQYNHVHDRFLRVQFVEESENGRIAANSRQTDEIWKRLLRTLFQGIKIGDRRYEFLAFGSSQLRQCGVYFFCPTEHISCDDIRQWMGQFNHIKVVAKYAARLGQCFSTTREMRGIPVPDLRPIPDVERDGYCFTDGVGIISEFLARMIIEEMTLDVFSEPSAFQFRMGGCKGVLAVWPHAKKGQVHIRESQEKFKADARSLEIIRCAKFSTATLNRQTITILESLGIPIKIFEDLLDRQIRLHEEAMTNNTAAVEILTRYVDENQSTLVLAEFLQAGFKTDTIQEPFVMNLLNLWRSWSLKLLKEKARIQVEKSAFVLGCVDETGTLRGHLNATEGSPDKDVNKLPQIFLQLSDPQRYNKTNIIRGVCIVGRNPSLHPGDIRVVQAVDNPKLHHLKDVVVFPSKGDRPVPNMLSGGDLDGDDFFIIWDPNLIPKEWNYPAMNYTGPKPQQLDRDVNVDDLRNFFVKYMKNDVLPLIATSHLAFADIHGPKSPLCLHLADLHSKAVDYPKTGEPAEWSAKYNPQKWPHFMEKKSTYKSKKALGIIYDKVVKHSIQFLPDWERAFDQRVINRFELDNTILKEARRIKSQYDTAVRRILSQHNVETEFELYTGWAMSRPPIGSDYKRQEDLGREYDALKQRFRDTCYEAAGGYDEARVDKFVAAMYNVTEQEIKIALYEHHRGPTNEAGEIHPPRQLEAKSMPLISFPWLFPWVMARIASGGKYNPKNSILAAAHRRTAVALSGSPGDAQADDQPDAQPDAQAVSQLQRDESLQVETSDAKDEVVETMTSNSEESLTEPQDEIIKHEPEKATAMDRLAGLVDSDDEE